MLVCVVAVWLVSAGLVAVWAMDLVWAVDLTMAASCSVLAVAGAQVNPKEHGQPVHSRLYVPNVSLSQSRREQNNTGAFLPSLRDR